MSTRYPGGIITKTPVVPTLISASGIWTLDQQLQAKKAGIWPTLPARAIAVASNDSPYITAYPWSGSGFGTKYSNPATLPTGTGQGVAFSSNGSDVAVAISNASPYVLAYPWSGSGFGTKYSDPATLPTSTGNGVAWGTVG